MKRFLFMSLISCSSVSLYSSIIDEPKKSLEASKQAAVYSQASMQSSQPSSPLSKNRQNTNKQNFVPTDEQIIEMNAAGYSYDREANSFEYQESSFNFLTRFLCSVPQLVAYVCADSDLMGSFESSAESDQSAPEKEKQD